MQRVIGMTAVNLIGGIIFSTIGLVSLIYGKKQSDIKAMIVGMILITYPYFITNTAALYVIGVILTAVLFIRI